MKQEGSPVAPRTGAEPGRHRPRPRQEPARGRTRLRASSIRILVVGDDDLGRSIEEVAGQARRRVVGQLTVPAREHGAASAMAELDWDELVVDERLFDDTRLNHPDLVARAGRVWLAAGGADMARTFSPLPPVGRFLKRAVDILVAALMLLLTLPVLLVSMLVVALDSEGPVFFTQLRVGRNGQRYRLYKLRTMRTRSDDERHRAYFAALVRGEAAAQNGVFKLADDDRITGAGRVLRRLSIDELPQLWNVLRGDMSLVGPRPMQPHELDLCDSRAWRRLAVRPGLTGVWQVSGRGRLSFEEMIAMDVDYCRSWSLVRDLKILARTPKAVLTGDGAA